MLSRFWVLLFFVAATLVGCRTVTNTELTMRMMMRPYLQEGNPVYPNFDDPVFGFKTRVTGILNPRQFADEIGFWIFMTEPHIQGRIPVVFVHGHFAGPQAFKKIADSLDKTKYEPWFAYYPSGLDIRETADMFRQNLARTAAVYGQKQVVVIAMSMGGLVVREGLKAADDGTRLPKVPLFIGISNPWGGSIKTGAGANLALTARPGKKISYGAESWSQFEGGAPFIATLYDKPLPEETVFHIIYGVGGEDDSLPGRDDGSLPEESLARPEAVAESSSVTVVDDALHGTILDFDETAARCNEILAGTFK